MKSVWIFCIVFLIISCEYKVEGDFYRDVAPPEVVAPFEIRLDQVHPADTIYIFAITQLSLRLNTDGKELYDLTIAIDGKALEYYRPYDASLGTYQFTINPWEFSNGKHKLLVNVITASGSGSLADMMKMEGFQGEMAWNVYIINDFEDNFNIGYRKTEDDLLEFYWELPDIPQGLFDKYEIKAGSELLSITDQSRKSVIVKDYVCGDVQCWASVLLKTYDGYTRQFFKYINFTSPIPQLYFKDISLDKLLIYWDKPFSKARFRLSEEYTNGGIQTTDTFLIVPQVPFSGGISYYLFIYPEKSQEIYSYIFSSRWHSISSSFPYASNIVYHTAMGKILAISNDQVLTIDPTTFNETVQAKLPYSSFCLLSCVQGSSKIAIRHETELWIYPDHNFTNPLVVPNKWNWDPIFFQLTNNDRMFIIDFNNDAEDVCNVYDAINGADIFSFNVHRANPTPKWSISADGKYFCEATPNGMTIHQIGETDIEQTIQVSGYYTDAMFNPVNPNQLVVKERDNIQIFESSNFTNPVHSFVISASARLLNIDPATGYLLYLQRYSNRDTLRVAPPELVDKPLFSIATSYPEVVLIDNCLINKDGAQIFNITPYLKP